MFGNPKEIFTLFLIIGILSLMATLVAAYYIFKAINKWEKEEKEYRNKPKEIIVTIRNESDKEKIINQIIQSETSNNDGSNFRERSEPKF